MQLLSPEKKRMRAPLVSLIIGLIVITDCIQPLSVSTRSVWLLCSLVCCEHEGLFLNLENLVFILIFADLAWNCFMLLLQKIQQRTDMNEDNQKNKRNKNKK